MTAAEQDLSDLETISRKISSPKKESAGQKAFSRLTADMRRAVPGARTKTQTQQAGVGRPALGALGAPAGTLRGQNAFSRLTTDMRREAPGSERQSQASQRSIAQGSLRASSNPSVNLRVPSGEFAFSRLTGRRRRNAFGVGQGLEVALAASPNDIDSVFRNLAIWSEKTEQDQSFIPLLKMGPTIVGKLSVAIGADMLTLGVSRHQKSLVSTGSVCIGVGVIAVMLGMKALTYDMHRINPGRIPITLVFSLLGMFLISGALVFSETELGAQNLGIRFFSAIMFGLGLTLLNTSLPLSFAYSEMVHGDVFRSYRNEAAFLLWGVGLGMATGLTASRGGEVNGSQPKVFPFGVTHGFAVGGIACATLGTCLVATNLQRQVGLLLGLRTRVRRVATEVRGEEAI